MGKNMKTTNHSRNLKENPQQHSYNNVTNDVAYKDSCFEFPTYLLFKRTTHSFQSFKTEQQQEKKQTIPQNSTND